MFILFAPFALSISLRRLFRSTSETGMVPRSCARHSVSFAGRTEDWRVASGIFVEYTAPLCGCRYRVCVCDASASIQRSADGSTNITTGAFTAFPGVMMALPITCTSWRCCGVSRHHGHELCAPAQCDMCCASEHSWEQTGGLSGLALPLHSESSRGAASSRKSFEQQSRIQTGHNAGRCSKSSKPQYPRRGRRQETRRVFPQAGHFARNSSDRKPRRCFKQVSRWPYLLVACSPLWSWLWFQHTGPLSQRTDDCDRLHEIRCSVNKDGHVMA